MVLIEITLIVSSLILTVGMLFIWVTDKLIR